MDKTLILTVDLPRSGKSTWAKITGFPIINRDAIRLALHGKAYIQEAEDMVTAFENYMVKALFLAGHNRVIIDAMNLKDTYRERWIKGPWEIRVKVFDVSPEVCINRAIKSDREDLIPIINRNAPFAEGLDFLAERKYDEKNFSH